MANAGKMFETLANALREFDPAFQARQAQREQTRQSQAFQLKRDELQAKAREDLEKKRAKLKAQQESDEREAEETRRKDAFDDIGTFLATRTEPEAFPQPFIPTVPGLPGPMQPPQLAVAPPQDTAAGVTLGVEEAAQRAGLGASAVGRLLEQRFPEPTEAKEPTFQIRQDKSGEYVLIPTTPGVKPSKTGVIGETGKGKTTLTVNLPKPLSPESAGKAAMVQSAINDLSEVKKFLIPEGKVSRSAVASMAARLPGTEGRDAAARMFNALEVKLRQETGAVATVEEIENMGRRFRPSVLDSKKTIRQKLSRLELFFQFAEFFQDPSGAWQVKWNELERQPKWGRDPKVTPEQKKKISDADATLSETQEQFGIDLGQ